ncbi:hypothetical protein ULMA_25470 [Patiriisocius marinus]|uniref:Uncharacterized protein n=1 Tax=Patiriisocius marinus TaxID=1397112 RepID=A0A5J4IRF0_9FLAO|nr:cell wall anchor protein [Patiriisocius marinus]GER60439.1 hypothetical protein ULMA_25470 [Patiriisocius marinus]
MGIGTTIPDPSALLELDSDEHGFLTPRMSTSLRNSISSPAKGLLVFDTDENVFYFFNGTIWEPIASSDKRDNYKLVKDISDLADELSGGTYILDENFMYEINGTILVDNPIDINGAYIRGHDTGEDILQNNSGGTLFVGNKGGRMKDILIMGNGQQVFDITGTGVENVILYSVVIVGASSVGSLNMLNTLYCEVLQIISCSNGISSNTVNNFYLDKGFFDASNSGTYLTLSGTFNNVQLANGRVVVDTGETGLDVLANPTITISASLSEISFAGDGTRVRAYTSGTYPGYNFTNEWDVNCPGIPIETDGTATGDINLDTAVGSGEITTFADNLTPTKILGTTTNNNLFRFSASGNNRIIYNGLKKRFFNISASISCQSANSGIYIFYLAKGSGAGAASILPETKVYRRFSSGSDIGGATAIGTIEMEPGDYVEVWAQRYSGTSNLLTVSLNLVAN